MKKTKRKQYLLTALLLLTSLITIQAQNLIGNPSFEFGIGDWVNGTWGGGGASYSQATEKASEGAASLEINVTTAADDAFKVFVRKNQLVLTSGKTYVISFDVWSNSGEEETIGTTLYSHTNIGSQQWGNVWSESALRFQGDGEWHSFKFTFLAQAVAGTPDFDALGLMFGFALKTGVFYLDNISLKLEDDDGGGNDVPTTYFVTKEGNDDNEGDEANPFLTISKTAQLAKPGDTILIGEGTYRETVTPARSGTENKPILYLAKGGEEVNLARRILHCS